jgi:hypothetical protein
MVRLQRAMTVTSFLHLVSTAGALGVSTLLPSRPSALLR